MRLEYHARRAAFPILTGTPLAPVLDELIAVDEILAPAASSPRHLAGCLTIWCTRQGEATMATGDGVLRHRPQRLAAVSASTTLANIGNAQPWNVAYLMLRGPWPATADAAITRMGSPLIDDRPPTAVAQVLFSAVTVILDQPEGWTWRVAAALAVILPWCEQMVAGVPRNQPEHTWLARAAHAVDGAPQLPWRTGELARELQCSPRSLQRHFHDSGLPPPDRWAVHRRLDHARLLLRQGLSVSACATATGFVDPFHFSRLYARRFGYPPSRESD